MNANSMELLLQQAGALLDRLEACLPDPAEPTDWSQSAYRWVNDVRGRAGSLQAIASPQMLDWDQLRGIDRQKAELARNTQQFLAGLPANNALLWGARGTGKSSLVKALLKRFADQGLRMIEVEATELVALSDIVAPLQGRKERYIVYADDLSFEADDPSYKALKAHIEGSLLAPPDNVLIYATSNRRHLLPEFHADNRQTDVDSAEIHPAEAVEEKISLSERFGLWLSFHPFGQAQYLDIVESYLADEHLPLDEQARMQALRWALARGSRSGRVAWQFARDWVGKSGLA